MFGVCLPDADPIAPVPYPPIATRPGHSIKGGRWAPVRDTISRVLCGIQPDRGLTDYRKFPAHWGFPVCPLPLQGGFQAGPRAHGSTARCGVRRSPSWGTWRAAGRTAAVAVGCVQAAPRRGAMKWQRGGMQRRRKTVG